MAECTFFLGTHEPSWLRRAEVPLFVSRRRLARLKSYPRARSIWALDSGGFTELSDYGGWTIDARTYVGEVRRIRDEVGNLLWAAPQDWMCEPDVVKNTGLSVAEHQRRTIANYLELRNLAPDLPFIPVLQGFNLGDHQRHWADYEAAGVHLEDQPIVGVGTVCRRQHTAEALAIFRSLRGLRLHGFGVKTLGLAKGDYLLTSADSLAWSKQACELAKGRRKQGLPGTICGRPHARNGDSCANCWHYAMDWRERIVSGQEDRAVADAPQQRMFGVVR